MELSRGLLHRLAGLSTPLRLGVARLHLERALPFLTGALNSTPVHENIPFNRCVLISGNLGKERNKSPEIYILNEGEHLESAQPRNIFSDFLVWEFARGAFN